MISRYINVGENSDSMENSFNVTKIYEKLKTSGEIKKIEEEEKNSEKKGKIISDEEISHGKIDKNVYLNYIRAGGGLKLIVLLFFVYCGEQIFKGKKYFFIFIFLNFSSFYRLLAWKWTTKSF